MQGLIITPALTLTRSIQKNILLILPFLVFSLFTCPLKADEPPKSPLPIVVISQIVQHVSLDQEREGIMAADHPLVLKINLKSAQEMGITIPNDIKSKAKIIGDQA